MSIQKLACPKCGATNNLFAYEAQWAYYSVGGFDPKTGCLDMDFEDSTCDINNPATFMKKLVAALGEASPPHAPTFLAHLPDGDDAVCHVWYMPKKSELQDPMWAMANSIRNGLNGLISLEQGHEIATKHCKSPLEKPEEVLRRYLLEAGQRPKRQHLAKVIAEMLVTSEEHAMKMVESYYARGLDNRYGDDPKEIVIRYLETSG